MAQQALRFDATLNERTYDESGKAIRELRRSTGHYKFFIIQDNLCRSFKTYGRSINRLNPSLL